MKKDILFFWKKLFVLFFAVSLFFSINVSAEEAPFRLISAEISEKSSTVEGEIKSFTDEEIKNNITFHRLGDHVTLALTLKSNLASDISIQSISDDNENAYISYKYDQYADEIIKAGEQFALSIKAVYETELTDLSQRAQANNVKITINYIENEEEKTAQIGVNPNTDDPINWSYFLLAISVVGLVICFTLEGKKAHKVAVIMLVAVSAASVAKAMSFAFEFTLNDDYGIYDKQRIEYIVDNEDAELITSYGDPASSLNTPTKRGYSFAGWTFSDGSSYDPALPVTDDLTIYANFDIDNYSVSYDLAGGEVSIMNRTNYTINHSFTLNNPTKAHYDFIGWTGTDLTEPTKDVTVSNQTGNREYVANYAPINYDIDYTGLTDAEKATLNNSTSYNIETPEFTLTNPATRMDSDGDPTETFAGWREGNTTSTTITLPNQNSLGDKSFEAIWTAVEPNTYTISYELNGGTLSAANPTDFTKFTDAFTLNNPTKTGYSFVGWTGSNGTTPQSAVSVEKGTRESLNFVANYEANNYSIIFDKNADDASGAMANQSMTYDVEAALNDNQFTRAGYTFKGWNTEKDGTGTSYSNQAKVKNLATSGTVTLYAQWKKQTLYAAAKLGDYVRYTPSVASYNISGDGSYCYYGPTDRANGNAINAMSVSPSSVTSWRVVSKDDSAKTVTLVPATSGGTVTMNGRGYGCYEDNLSRISAQFKDNTFAASSNYMTEANYQLVKKSGVGIIDNAAIGKKEIIASGSYLGYYVYYSLNNNSERFEIANQRSTPTSLTPEYSFFDKEFNILPLVTIKTGILVNSGSGTSASPWMMTTE